MAVDLKKNKDSLVQAYQKVFDAQDDTNWAVFGYEGLTNYLTVVETGNGGIEELADELSSGKMMYGYCQVTDPNTSLPKYVLIHWTGEGVPENIKLKYTSHLRDVQNFIRSIHITVPARNEDDIDLNDIMKRVAKSSGANYSFHKEKAKPEESPAPVGTDYKRVIPTKEINISRRDQFWAEAEKVEIQRQNEEKAKSEEERKLLEEDRKNREIREAKERERRISEHMKEVQQQRLAEKKSEEKNKEIEKRNWEKVQRESSIDEEERGHRSDQMRRERASEAAHLVSSSTSSARDFFKQKSMERPGDSNSRAPPPPRKLKHGFGAQSSEGQQDAPMRKQPIQLPSQDEGNVAPPSKPARQPEPKPEPEPYTPEPEPEPVQEPEPEYEPEPVPQAKVLETTNLMKQSLPPRQDSDVEDEEDQNWDEPPAEDFTFRENRVPSFHEDYSAEQQHAETQSHRVSATQHFVEQEEEQQELTPAVTEDQGLCARALYDYQASDDTEITFDPDDIITNIEQIDAGWWQGFSPDGSYGMFPANFVELIN